MLLINDLQRHNGRISSEIIEAVRRVMEKGWYVLGYEVEQFEAEFGAYNKSRYCVGVANGTEALELSLRALGVGVGHKVATVANAGMYSTTAIRNIGAIPVYIDITAESFTMDPESLETQIKNGLSAVIVTHLYGRMAEMEPIASLCSKASVPIIEDCAQAHGAEWAGKRAGTWGIAGCFSFYPTKNLGALGDAGAVITDDAEIESRIRQLRQYGWNKKYQACLPFGRNSRLDEMQAAILRTKLPYLESWNADRRRIAQAYNKGLETLEVVTPKDVGPDYVAHLYVIRCSRREHTREFLRSNLIATDIHYPIPDHEQVSYRDSERLGGGLPQTVRAAAEVLTLPCFPEMTQNEVEKVIFNLQEALK